LKYEGFADLLEGFDPAVIKAETHDDDFPLLFLERIEHFFDLFPELDEEDAP